MLYLFVDRIERLAAFPDKELTEVNHQAVAVNLLKRLQHVQNTSKSYIDIALLTIFG
jgi:hypothetical protein